MSPSTRSRRVVHLPCRPSADTISLRGCRPAVDAPYLVTVLIQWSIPHRHILTLNGGLDVRLRVMIACNFCAVVPIFRIEN